MIRKTLKLELSNNNLIVGKRYYFENIDRKIHFIFGKDFCEIRGKKSVIEKFDFNKLLLRSVVLKNNRIVSVILNYSVSSVLLLKMEHIPRHHGSGRIYSIHTIKKEIRNYNQRNKQNFYGVAYTTHHFK